MSKNQTAILVAVLQNIPMTTHVDHNHLDAHFILHQYYCDFNIGVYDFKW